VHALFTVSVCLCVRVWQTVINNVCNVLPTEWSTTHARELLQSSLNVSAVKVSHQISELFFRGIDYHICVSTAMLVMPLLSSSEYTIHSRKH